MKDKIRCGVSGLLVGFLFAMMIPPVLALTNGELLDRIYTKIKMINTRTSSMDDDLQDVCDYLDFAVYNAYYTCIYAADLNEVPYDELLCVIPERPNCAVGL